MISFILNYFGIYKVDKVIDGDSFSIGKKQYRLHAVDTPEYGQQFFEDARNFLKLKIEGRYVYLSFFDKDQYDRDVVSVRTLLDKVDVAREIILNGLGYAVGPTYFAAEKSAKSVRLNLFAIKGFIKPYVFRAVRRKAS